MTEQQLLLKARLRQKLQEKILTQGKTEEPKYSIGGFFSNVKSDAGEIVRGIGSLLGMGGKAIMHPIETIEYIKSPEFPQALKQIGSGIVSEYKEYKQPLKKLYEDPIDVVVDALTVATLGGAAITKVGTAAKIPALTKAGEAVSYAAKPITVSKDLAKFNISKIPGGPEFLTALEQRAKTISLVTKTQQAHLIERNKLLNEVDKTLKVLTPAEKATLIPYAEGTIQELAITPSTNFNKATDLVKKLAEQREKLIGPEGLGKLTVQQIENRKWQPILKQLYPDGFEKKIEIEVPENLQKEIGNVFEEVSMAEPGYRFSYIPEENYNRVFGGVKSTFPKWIPEGLREKKLLTSTNEKILAGMENFTKRENALIDVMKAEVSERAGVSVGEITTKILAGQAETIKIERSIPSLIKETQELFSITRDPIYVQHIFTDKPKKFTDFFINTAPVKNWKPGFLKRSYGVKGYSVDPNEVLKWEAAQTLKFKNNIDLLEKVKMLDFVEPLDNLKNLKAGYKVFAPDGYIRFYQGTIDLVKEFGNKLKQTKQLDKVEDIWDNFKNVIDSSLLEKKYIGVTSKVKLYQVPNASAKILQGYAKAVNPYLKLFIDKPVDAFRFLALALTPRWLVNNMVGNTIFSIIAGDPLSPAGYLLARKAQELGLVPDEVFSGFYRTEQLMTGKLGRAAETRLGRILSGVGEKIVEAPIIKQIKQFGDLSYKINAVTDDWYRSAHYVNKATKLAKQKILKESGEKLNNTIKLLEYAKQDPEIVAKAIKSVDDFFYSASKLSPFERRVVRRFLPFYSWYKFIALYSAKLPFEHPGRFNIIRNLAQGFYQLTGQDQLPTYLKGSVPIGETETGDIYYLRTSGMNPFGLLEDLVTIGPAQTALYSLTPPVKTTIERLTARESFTGKTYTAKDIIENYGGRLYKFNQETGNIEEIEEKVKPVLLEHLLRNYIPQYQMMEQAIIGGAQSYTAAGLPSLISGEGIKKSPITGEPITKIGASQKVKLRALGLLGIPISLRTAEQQQIEQEVLQGATSQYFYQQFPMLSPQFKNKIKDELGQRILKNIQQKGIIEGLW